MGIDQVNTFTLPLPPNLTLKKLLDVKIRDVAGVAINALAFGFSAYIYTLQSREVKMVLFGLSIPLAAGMWDFHSCDLNTQIPLSLFLSSVLLGHTLPFYVDQSLHLMTAKPIVALLNVFFALGYALPAHLKMAHIWLKTLPFMVDEPSKMYETLAEDPEVRKWALSDEGWNAFPIEDRLDFLTETFSWLTDEEFKNYVLNHGDVYNLSFFDMCKQLPKLKDRFFQMARKEMAEVESLQGSEALFEAGMNLKKLAAIAKTLEKGALVRELEELQGRLSVVELPAEEYYYDLLPDVFTEANCRRYLGRYLITLVPGKSALEAFDAEIRKVHLYTKQQLEQANILPIQGNTTDARADYFFKAVFHKERGLDLRKIVYVVKNIFMRIAVMSIGILAFQWYLQLPGYKLVVLLSLLNLEKYMTQLGSLRNFMNKEPGWQRDFQYLFLNSLAVLTAPINIAAMCNQLKLIFLYSRYLLEHFQGRN